MKTTVSKSLTLVFIGLFNAVSALCQIGEFMVHPNGLIYNEHTMNMLSKTVDSLNLKFKICDYNKAFYAKSQTIGHKITLKSGNIQSARKDLDQQISLADFQSKYPKAIVQKDILILKHKYRNYNEVDMVEIAHFDLKSDYGFSLEYKDTALYTKDFAHTWIYSYNAKTTYSEESITAFYFPNNFETAKLPQKYALMVGYADCLIDTSSQKFRDKMNGDQDDLPNNWMKLSETKKEKLLEELRSTRVIGGCSMDSRPRQHAVNIAMLSAETNNWEVFLKAHLDVMNDRFERVSDGSYAWGERHTYLKELEELNINVADLIFGISLRISNPAKNHYYGSITRVGRALAESKNTAEIEEIMLSAVSDTELDYNNRLLFYFLFNNYNFYLKDLDVKKVNSDRLAKAATTFPDFISRELLSQ